MSTLAFVGLSFIGWPVAFIYWLYHFWAARPLIDPDGNWMFASMIPVIGIVPSVLLILVLSLSILDDIVTFYKRKANERWLSKRDSENRQ